MILPLFLTIPAGIVEVDGPAAAVAGSVMGAISGSVVGTGAAESVRPGVPGAETPEGSPTDGSVEYAGDEQLISRSMDINKKSVEAALRMLTLILKVIQYPYWRLLSP
jgi:hypothetical protein